jgi:hypothetical protein
LKPWLRAAIQAELERREQGDQEQDDRGQQTCPPVDWSAVIRRWHRELVLRWHPDRGGTKEAAQAIEDAHDLLKRLVGAG